MEISAARSELRQIPVRRVVRNKDNPRILFRKEELDSLLESIRTHGIQVPVSVYKDGGRYVLIDGERRWRCALKLNLATIPALVQDRPDRLTNILLMFNIHALREQWDLLTIALKLRDTIPLLARKLRKPPTEAEISRQTGLTRGVIRRCRLLIELPDDYKEMILAELEKPKSKQKITEDFFIEMERALKTVARAMPDVIPDKDKARRVLIHKFKKEIIQSRIQFRNVAKIARARNVESDIQAARAALQRLFQSNDYSIQNAYEDSVSEAYSERDVVRRLDSLIQRLSRLEASAVDQAIRDRLRQLITVAERLLQSRT